MTLLSQDHADGYQVVIVHGNTGFRVSQDEPEPSWARLDWRALDPMKACLERHGYKVTKPRKPKSSE